MKFNRAFLWGAISMGLTSAQAPVSQFTRAAVAPPTQASSAEAARAEKLIPQLDHPDPAVRHAAFLQLNSLGGDALPVIESASKFTQGSPEVLRRLKQALKILEPRAKREQEIRQRTQWMHQFFHDAYTQDGHSNSAWDPVARRAIDEYLKLGLDPLHGSSGPRDQLAATLKEAIATGCDDPMIRAMNKLVIVHPNASDVEFPNNRFPGGINAFVASPYPALAKVRIVIQYLATMGSEPTMQEITVRRLFPELLRTPGLPAGEADALAFAFFSIEDANNGIPALSQFISMYKMASPQTPGPLLLSAKLDFRLAWEAAHTNHRGFGEPFYIDQSKNELDQAMAMAPNDFRGPTLMVTWEALKADDGTDTRHDMENWFSKAVELNPDDFEAYSRKLIYLEPVWHGSANDMIEFGRECLKTENWRAGIPFMLARAHEWLASNSKDTAEYFSRPQVWQDVDAVYGGAVLNFPDNFVYRSQYAKYAAKCGHWDVAHEQFEKIGDRPALSVFVSRESYNYLRRKAARLVRQGTTKPAGS